MEGLEVRRILLLLALGLPRSMAATDLSGIWTGTWQHQGESQGVCLYLSPSDKGVKGQIAYRHDTRESSIDVRLPSADTVEFAIADKDQGIVNFRLKDSEEVLAG